MKNLIYSILIYGFVMGCTGSTDIKEIKDLKGSQWPIAKKVVFKFKINDPSKVYKINYLLRNSIEYPYYNIYLNQTLKDISGKTTLVSSMDELILFDKKTGKPMGDGIGDIYDNRFTSKKLSNIKFPKAGEYQWIVTHNMRPDPLIGVMSLGMEVLEVK